MIRQHRAAAAAVGIVGLVWLGTGRGHAADDCPGPAGFPWPREDWRTVPAGEAARDPAALQALDALAFPPGRDEAEQKGPQTHGLLIVKDGRIVYERYGAGFAADTPHILWSATKSMLHAVYGAAVRDGLIDIDRPVAERSPWIGEGAKRRITYRHLLQMRSGIAFNEAYEFAPLRSSIIAMLYTRGRHDMARFAAAQPLAAEPGTRWAYKGGDSLILAAALRDLVGRKRYPDYPWTALFDRLGIRSAVWERDGAGTFVGSSYLYLTPRDLARLGLLYVMDGCWVGMRLLPEGWVAFAGTLSPPLATPEGQPRRRADQGPASYGAHWWLNQPGPAPRRPMPAAPEDMLNASGHWGQDLFVLPREGLVIVRTAHDRGDFPVNDLLRLTLQAFAAEG